MSAHKVGETFWFNINPDKKVELKVVTDRPGDGCDNCYLKDCTKYDPSMLNNIDPCLSSFRPDHLDIHYEEIK